MFGLTSSVPLVILLLLGAPLFSSIEAQENPYRNNSYNHDEYERESKRVSNLQPVAGQPGWDVVARVPHLGEVRGKLVSKNIKAFLGLQYGRVKPGLGRFQKAVPVESNNNNETVIDATREATACPQFPNLKEVTEEEFRGVHFADCLYLNVYARNHDEVSPVMVYIHGEMLFDGSAEEAQPDYLVQHRGEENVVLVSVSYRLAPFGFLTTLTDELPGNVALADIQMALEWVQANIQYFGGTPQHVTLFGQAGGATLVHALSLSGKAQGLFHRVILQSGTALNPYFLDEDPLSTARSLARLARCPVTGMSPHSLRGCFERIRTSHLLAAFKRHREENEPRGLRFMGGFKLVVGDKLGYLPKHPAALVAENRYPLIAGVTKDAGAFIMSRFYNQLLQVRSRNLSDYIDVVLKHTTHARFYGIWKRWALTHIFGEQDVRRGAALADVAQGLLELTNLILYRAPLIDSIRHTWPQFPTFLYCFDYRGEFHRFSHLRNPLPFEPDATLSDDNIYLFPYPPEVAHLNGVDTAIADLLSSMWINFAGYSVPRLDGETWLRVTSEYGPFVRIGNTRPDYLELDYHFGEGIPVPNLYPEYFNNSTATSTTTTSTTTERPAFLPPFEEERGYTRGDIISRFVENPLAIIYGEQQNNKENQTNNQHQS